MNASRTIVNVPYPAVAPDWTLRTLTCGVALQCSPSKDRIAHYPLHELSRRELRALTIVEGEVALGWVGSRWPGLLSEFRRLLPDLEMNSGELDGPAMLDRAKALARSGRELRSPSLLGQLPLAVPAQRGLLASVRRMYGRMPWSSKRTLSRGTHTFYNRLFSTMGLGPLTPEVLRPGPPYFFGDWLDTIESEKLLAFQRHSIDDVLFEMKANVGSRRWLLKMVAPLVNPYLAWRSPHRART